MQITENLVTAERHVRATALTRTRTLAGEVRVHEFLGLDILPLEQQPPDFRQDLVRIGPVRVLWGTGPDGTLVQHDSLLVHSAKNHRPNASVAERQRLLKTGRWLVEPEGGS